MNLPAGAPVPIVDWFLVRSCPHGLPIVQKKLTFRLDQALQSTFFEWAPLLAQVRLSRCSAGWAGLWITTCSSERQLSVSNSEYRFAARLRLDSSYTRLILMVPMLLLLQAGRQAGKGRPAFSGVAGYGGATACM